MAASNPIDFATLKVILPFIKDAVLLRGPHGIGKSAVPAGVSIWIGAIPAIDAATCFLIGRPLLGLLCIGLWGMSGALRPRYAGS